MDAKYSLKENLNQDLYALNHPAVRQIAKELTDKGIAVFARGQCYIPAADETRAGDYVTPFAFRTLCIMLQEERNKKWWQRRKR